MAFLRRLTFALLALSFACDPAPAPGVADGDLLPEEALTGAALRSQWTLAGALHVSDVLAAPQGATRVGALVEIPVGAPVPSMEARGVDADGHRGPWLPLEVTWSEATQLVARVDLGETWAGAQLRLDARDLQSLIWSAVIPATPTVEVPAGEVGSVAAPLRSDLAALGVVSRSEWGARSGSGCSSNTDKYRMAIHHTVTPATSDPATRIRGIQSYHMDSNGWCDIGYHFLVSLDGRMWEGRPLAQLGTHVGSNNTGNIGISYIGCFQSSGCNDWRPFTPPDAMIEAGATLVREMSRIYGITVNATNVKGHRDHSGATTSCPGDNLHALLPEIRERASGPSGPVWSATYVDQSFPLARDPFVIAPGEEVAGYIELRNTGTDAWRPDETFLGTTEPRDGDSALAASDWINAHRPATVNAVVEPGETGRFEFSVRAPTTAGEYPQYFNLVQEDVAWFSAPTDDQLQVRVTVEMDAPEPVDAGPTPTPDAGPSTPTDGGVPTPGADMGGTSEPGPTSLEGDGCGCRVAGSSREAGSLPWFALLPLTLLVWRRFN